MTVNELTEIANIKAVLTEADKELIGRAFDFAQSAHKGQKRQSGEPYINHPLKVAYGVAEMGLDVSAISAALLHDVCEDTSCDTATIEKNFGKDVAFLVDGVTKLDKIRFHGTEREAENLRKMFLAIAEDIRVVLIKLMDRRHNMKTLSSLPPEKQKRIALETLELYAPLAYRLGIGEIKGQLEDLAFPYVYPKEHEWLIEQVKDQLVLRQKYAERLIPLVKKELEAENIHYRDVHGRD